MRSGWDKIAFWVWHVTSYGLGQTDCSGELRSPITHGVCVIGKFSFTISDPVHFEVNWIVKATELTNINVVRENTENFPSVSIIYIKCLD